MRSAFLSALASTLLLAGCAYVRQAYGIPDPNAGRLTPEARAELVAQSVRDSSVVFANDTAYYIGRPIFRSMVRSNSYQSAVDLTAFTGMATATVYMEDPRETPNSYLVILESPHKILSATATGGLEEVVGRLMKRKVLAPSSHEYSAANLRSAVAAGLFRERPDLDSAHAEERRREMAEAAARREERSRPSVSSTPRSSGSSSSSSSGSGSSSTQETEAEKAQRRFFNSPSVRNTCSKTVRVFVGDKPPYSSGINMTVSGNSINSSLTGLHSGVKFWIIDEHEQPITGITVGDDTREIEIGSDGRTLRQK